MNRSSRRRLARANAEEAARVEKNLKHQLELKKPLLMGNCFECKRQLYSNDKVTSVHGRYFCDNETVSQLIFKIEERILNERKIP